MYFVTKPFEPRAKIQFSYVMYFVTWNSLQAYLVLNMEAASHIALSLR